MSSADLAVALTGGDRGVAPASRSRTAPRRAPAAPRRRASDRPTPGLRRPTRSENRVVSTTSRPRPGAPAALEVLGQPTPPGPVVALGLVWAAALVGAAALGPGALLVLLVPVAVVASASGLRAARGRAEPLRVAGIVCGPLLAALTVGVIAGQDSGVALILIMTVCLFDAANFLTGTGEVGGVAGSLVGAVTVALLMVILAAVVPTPLAGHPIDVFAVVAVVLCPAGVQLGRRLSGPTRLPAFRRLDSLMLVGPAWVLLTAVLLHR